MKIATWNVNSVQVRLPQVLDWLQEHDVDILALQETKVVDEAFPVEAFKAIGYHVSCSGQKSYNGVALISKEPLQQISKDHPYFQDPARRFMAATIEEIRIINLYVPNGQSVDSEKYHYKLNWLQGMKQCLQAELAAYPHAVVLGDFNIAPADLDVHDPAVWAGSVLVSPQERDAFASLIALGFTDALRHIHADPGLYTWWDYRQGAFRRDLGMRIDHILLSKPLMARCKAVVIDKGARKAERPSDHAPVWVDLSL